MQPAYPCKSALDTRGALGCGVYELYRGAVSQADFGNIGFYCFVRPWGSGADVAAAQGRGILAGLLGIFRGLCSRLRAGGAGVSAHALEGPRRPASERPPRLSLLLASGTHSSVGYSIWRSTYCKIPPCR